MKTKELKTKGGEWGVKIRAELRLLETKIGGRYRMENRENRE